MKQFTSMKSRLPLRNSNVILHHSCMNVLNNISAIHNPLRQLSKNTMENFLIETRSLSRRFSLDVKVLCNSKKYITNEYLWVVFERQTNTFFVPVHTFIYSTSFSLSLSRLHSVDQILELCDNVHSSIDAHAQLNGQKQNIRDEAQRIQMESETLALR